MSTYDIDFGKIEGKSKQVRRERMVARFSSRAAKLHRAACDLRAAQKAAGLPTSPGGPSIDEIRAFLKTGCLEVWHPGGVIEADTDE